MPAVESKPCGHPVATPCACQTMSLFADDLPTPHLKGADMPVDEAAPVELPSAADVEIDTDAEVDAVPFPDVTYRCHWGVDPDNGEPTITHSLQVAFGTGEEEGEAAARALARATFLDALRTVIDQVGGT